jgi:hypothetical protein
LKVLLRIPYERIAIPIENQAALRRQKFMKKSIVIGLCLERLSLNELNISQTHKQHRKKSARTTRNRRK